MFQKIKKRLLHYSWSLAYGDFDESIVFNGLSIDDLHFVNNPYENKWFADPFILEDGLDTIDLLVEEFDNVINRGRIAHLIVDKKTDKIVHCNIILDLPTHLSFPAIYRCNDKIYVHPENYKSGNSFIYEYDYLNDILINPVLVSNEALTDAVIVRKGDHYEMYSTLGENPNGGDLIIYRADSFLGKYTKISQQHFSHHSARMAGSFIQTSIGEIRPAQLCDGAYGRAVLFYHRDKVVGRLSPWGLFDGLHTFNVYKSKFVIDLKKYDFPWIYRITK